MNDERTLRLAHRPVTRATLEKYAEFVRLEIEGIPAGEALRRSDLTADDVARTASAVNAFCRPRLLKRRLARATATTPERQQKRIEELASAIDDTQFVALYGEETHGVLLGSDGLIELRAKEVGED